MLRPVILVAGLCLIGGCTNAPTRANEVDIAGAAATARGSVDNYDALPDAAPPSAASRTRPRRAEAVSTPVVAEPALEREAAADSAVGDDPPTPPPSSTTTRYRCDDDTAFTVVFDGDGAILRFGAGETARLTTKHAASGIWYSGDDYDLRGKGGEATLTRGRAMPVPCAADR